MRPTNTTLVLVRVNYDNIGCFERCVCMFELLPRFTIVLLPLLREFTLGLLSFAEVFHCGLQRSDRVRFPSIPAVIRPKFFFLEQLLESIACQEARSRDIYDTPPFKFRASFYYCTRTNKRHVIAVVFVGSLNNNRSQVAT